MSSLAYLMCGILEKKLNHNKDADILSVGVIEFVVMRAWFVEKNRGRRRNKIGGDRDCLSHNLNIINDYTYKY